MLIKLLAEYPDAPNGRVFGIHVRPERVGDGAAAGLPDLRWHDMRHRNAPRIERSGNVSPDQLGRHLRRTNPKTTFRYINPDRAARDRIVAALDELNDPALGPEDVPGVH